MSFSASTRSGSLNSRLQESHPEQKTLSDLIDLFLRTSAPKHNHLSLEEKKIRGLPKTNQQFDSVHCFLWFSTNSGLRFCPGVFGLGLTLLINQLREVRDKKNKTKTAFWATGFCQWTHSFMKHKGKVQLYLHAAKQAYVVEYSWMRAEGGLFLRGHCQETPSPLLSFLLFLRRLSPLLSPVFISSLLHAVEAS